MRGGGGGAGPAFGPAPFLLGGVGAAKGLLPCFLVPKRNQPTACTLALWWLKFGPTDNNGGRGGGQMRRAPTHLLARGIALSPPLWGGGGVNLRRHPPTKPPRPHKGKYKEKNFPAPSAPRIYRDMRQRRSTSDLPLSGGGGGPSSRRHPTFSKRHTHTHP